MSWLRTTLRRTKARTMTTCEAARVSPFADTECEGCRGKARGIVGCVGRRFEEVETGV